MKIKIIRACYIFDFESFVNRFVQNKEIIDIKYMISDGVHHAMIIYK